ncbi:MAG: DUF998 domain-containing protein [Candidatus Bathyarchaeota archaeon]|nr:DUF998 domain-containing protein [Candidatus Bathyarchaeota archaeon]
MKRQGIAAVTGLVAPFFTFTCIAVAIASWQSFSWTNNALSDLGVQSGITAPVFNGGLIVGGVLFTIFATGMFTFAGKTVVGKTASALLVLACISLICIGIFNENFRPTHFIVSVMLFVFLPIAMLVFTGAFWLEGKHKLSIYTVASALVAAAVWVLQYTVHYFPNVAIPEAVSGLAGAAWVFVLSWLMLKKAKQP